MATRSKAKGKQRGDTDSNSRFSGVRRLLRETISEIKKVTWPDKETTRTLTIVVIAVAVTLGAMLGGIDAIFVRLWEVIPTF